jgi:hypothetical protein
MAKRPDADEIVTKALKMRREHTEWLARVAEADRSTVAAVIDRALAHYASTRLQFAEHPPRRTPS